MKNKFAHDPTLSTSPICLTDPEVDFSIDLSLISTVEANPFYAIELGGLFTTKDKVRNYYETKLLPFSLKEGIKAWYDALPCGSIKSPQDLAQSYVDKYFPAHMQHAALQRTSGLTRAFARLD